MALQKPSHTEATQENGSTDTSATQDETVQHADTAYCNSQETPPTQPDETHSETTAVTHSSASVPTAPSGDFQHRMAEQGYEGLELGFGSFPILKLANEGVFTDEEDEEYGTEFRCLIQSTRIKHLYKQAGNNEGEVYYSYNGENLVKASEAGSATVEQLRQEFKEDGFDMEIKDYLEAVVLMDDPDQDFHGDMFILSIPPASRAKFAGLVATLELQGKKLRETLVVCLVGKKRKAKRGGSVYFPWNFKVA